MATKNVGDIRVGLVLDKAGFQSNLNSAKGTVESFTSGLASMAAGFLGVATAARTVWSAFQEFGKQETALNRVIAAVVRQGGSIQGLREQVAMLGDEFIVLGQREEAAWSGFQRLYQATGDTTKSFRLLRLALNFATAQGEDAETVAAALARAWSGQDRQLKMLLFQHGLAAKGIKEFTDYEKLMASASEDATAILSVQERQVYALKGAWDKLKDSIGEVITGPFLVELEYFTKLINQPWRAVGPLPAFAFIESIRNMKKELEDFNREAQNTKALSMWLDPFGLRQGKPVKSSDEGGDGKPEPYPSRFWQSREDFQVLLDAEKAASDKAKEAAETEGEILRANYDSFKAYQKALDEWNIKQSPAYIAATSMAELFGTTLVDALWDFNAAFSNLGDTLKRILASILMQLLQVKMQGWINSTFGLGSGAPTPPRMRTPGDSTTQGMGGYQPMGGGYQVTVNPHPSGTLFQVMRGNRVEFSKFAEDMYLVGGAAVASR